MAYLDKIFCASPHCQNDCGHRMTDEERDRLIYLNQDMVSYSYFCGEPDTIKEEMGAQNSTYDTDQ